MRADKNRLRFITILAAVLLFAACLVWFVLATNNASRAETEQRLAAVTRSVQDAVTLCYAIEGAYPENIEYLKENYGLSYDSDSYIVHYDRFAANIRPQVVVLERKNGA